MTAHSPERGPPLLRLLQQRQGLGDTAGKGIRTAQGRGGLGEPEQDIIHPAEIKAAFKYRDGSGEVPLAEEEKTDTDTRRGQAAWLIDHFGDPDRFFSMSNPLGERPQLGKAPG